MKAILTLVLDVIWKAVVAIAPKEMIKEILEDLVGAWVQKHLTADEIGNEIKDVAKWLKDRL